MLELRFKNKSRSDSVSASTLERRSLSFTVHKERSEDQRLELSGERLPGHMVCLL
jgi:hypothetical protein